MPDETTKPFNPLDKPNLAESIANAIDRALVLPLPPPKFTAPGLYFLYYTGSFEAYAPLVKFNGLGYHWPIYIGKAMPPGVRKGVVEQAKKRKKHWGIHERLQHHGKSIRGAGNLRVEDFLCRWLVMDEAFIHLGETLLITKFQPVWNSVLDGFGNKAVGGPRSTGKRTAWDTVHPGRQGQATASVDPARAHKLFQAISAHLAATLPEQVFKP